jgi:hypothetical protein
MKTKKSTLNFISKNLAMALVLVLTAFASINVAKADHGEASVSDIDHTGMGTFTGSYTHSGSDHVWIVFNATAGNTLTVNYSTGFNSYYWIYSANNGTVAVGNSTSNNLTLVSEAGGYTESEVATSGSFTYNVTSTGQYAIQVDAYLGGSGSYSVTLSGATSCTTLSSVTSTPTNGTNTGGVSTNLYIGYPNNSPSTTLTAVGGSSATWSPSTNLSCSTCLTPVFTPTSVGSFTYTATCGASSQSITICVKDIRVPNTSGTKAAVYMCHLEPGKTTPQTLAVVLRGISSHFQYHSGDKLGVCGNVCATSKRDFEVADLVVDEQYLEVMCTPNPFRNSFKLNYVSHSDLEATVSIYGMTGNLMETTTLSGLANEAELGTNLPNGIYTVSFIQGDSKKVFRMIKLD